MIVSFFLYNHKTCFRIQGKTFFVLNKNWAAQDGTAQFHRNNPAISRRPNSLASIQKMQMRPSPPLVGPDTIKTNQTVMKQQVPPGGTRGSQRKWRAVAARATLSRSRQTSQSVNATHLISISSEHYVFFFIESRFTASRNVGSSVCLQLTQRLDCLSTDRLTHSLRTSLNYVINLTVTTSQV